MTDLINIASSLHAYSAAGMVATIDPAPEAARELAEITEQHQPLKDVLCAATQALGIDQ